VRYTFLGPTGLRVSELCLGTMTFGEDWGWGADEATSRAVFEAFADAGGTFVDTADVYTGGSSEAMLGRFLAGRRDRFVVATKYSISTDPTDPNAGGNSRKNLTRSLEASLRRLGTDHVDLYWVHLWDGLTPVEETVRALDDAVRAGKVLHVGFSDFPAWVVARADALAEAVHLTRPAAIQVEYSLAAREAERELVPMADALGLSVLDWSPLAGGALTGKRLPGAPADPDAPRVARADAVPHFARYRDRRTAAVAQEVVDVAAELGRSPAQVALAWVRHQSPLHIPVVGARTARHLHDDLGAVDLVLPTDALGRLDRVSAIEAGFPLDFLRAGQDGWFGPTVRRLDTRRPRPGQALLGLLPPSVAPGEPAGG
jgi:aryl-alcohol dehydrogenase-like predicted oxidoreductase